MGLLHYLIWLEIIVCISMYVLYLGGTLVQRWMRCPTTSSPHLCIVSEESDDLIASNDEGVDDDDAMSADYSLEMNKIST